jgi:polysaccharide export outer membrane protein
MQHVKSPVVDLRLSNFKITVIGEVNKPATFIINDEQVNVLEALGLAGDMTVYGRRENVLIIRNEDGNKTMTRLNLNKLESMKSPYFNLKQNDIVYIEPDRSKAVEYSQNTRLMPLIIASISAVAVLAAVLLKR